MVHLLEHFQFLRTNYTSTEKFIKKLLFPVLEACKLAL